MNERSNLLSSISDRYKELNGTRPRFNTDKMTMEELRQWHNQILTDIRNEMDFEQKEERDHNLAVERSMTVHSGFSIGELIGD